MDMNAGYKIKEIMRENISFEFGEIVNNRNLYMDIVFEQEKVSVVLKLNGYGSLLLKSEKGEPFSSDLQTTESLLFKNVVKILLIKQNINFLRKLKREKFLTTKLLKEVAIKEYKKTLKYKMICLYDLEFKENFRMVEDELWIEKLWKS